MSDKMDTDKRIVKFKVAGLKPDVRLKVFDNLEFHVHSALLKLYSAFFRKFLDSPKKKVPASKDFAYEWVTKIDEDGSWYLVAALAVEDQDITNPPIFKGVQELEEETFTRLLKAIYNERYELYDAEDLLRLTDIADYYCALPVVSKSLDAVVLHSDNFQLALQREPCNILPAVYRLRNATLFKECLIFILSDWGESEWANLESAVLRSIALKGRARIYELIGKVHENILSSLHSLSERHAEDHKTTCEFMQFASATATTKYSTKKGLSLPRYYRMLLNYVPPVASDGVQFTHPFVNLDMFDLLGNRTTYNTYLKAGDGHSQDSFYCAWIDDKDLPWDTSEDDW